MSEPTPYELYEQTGGGDAYRVAMLEHGHIIPLSPTQQRLTTKLLGKRVQPCGLTHEPDWSEWRDYADQGERYQGRWCRVCARTSVREAGA